MKPVHRKLICVLLVALAVQFSLYFLIFPSEQSEYKVKIVFPPNHIGSLPMWVAIEEGFFTKEGVVIDPIKITDSPTMVEYLKGNNADILAAVALPDLVNHGSLSSGNAKIFSHTRLSSSPPFDSLLVLPDSEITNPKQLEGKKVAVYPGITHEGVVRHYLKNVAKVNVDQIKFRKIAPPQHFRSLASKDVDAIFIYEPFRTQLMQENHLRPIMTSVYAELTDPSAIGVSAISKNFFSKHNDTAIHFTRAWDKAIKYINDHRDESAEILAKNIGIKFDVARSATWVNSTSTMDSSFEEVNATLTGLKNAKLVKDSFSLEHDMFFQSNISESPKV